MLTRIEIKENQYTRYKDADSEIPAGVYYKATKLPDGPIRRGVRAIPAQPVGRPGFLWLIPYEVWVKRVLEGYEPPHAKWYGKVPPDDPENQREVEKMFNLPAGLYSKLRAWHRQRLCDVCYQVSQFGVHRRSENAPIGAGKTLYGLCLAAMAPGQSIVLAPRHLHKNWADEAVKWGLPLPKLSTYHSAHKLLDTKPVVVIGDEALYAMNPTTGLHKNFKDLAMLQTVKIATGYTGSTCSTTPANQRWLRCVSPGCVPDDAKAWDHLFGLDTQLVDLPTGGKAYETTRWDADAIAEFLKPYLGVVSRDELKKELPEVTYQVIRTPKPKHLDLIKKGGGTERTASKRTAQIRQASDGFMLDDLGDAVPMDGDKIPVAVEWATSAGEPVVLYAAWDWTIAQLAEALPGAAVLKGGSDFDAELAKFLNGQTPYLIASTRISTGMNLQERCRLMGFVSNGLNPIDRQQAEGRIVRPGQKNGCVIVDFVADETLDEKVLTTLREHGDLSEDMVESLLAKCLDGGA